MLEWYRPHFDMYRLINEVDDLLQNILDCESAETVSYQFIFQQYVGIDPLSAELSELIEKAQEQNLTGAENEDRDTLLQFLFSTLVEPEIGKTRPIAVYHFPFNTSCVSSN